MAQIQIISRRKAFERTLDRINRLLADALFDDPAETGQETQRLRAGRVAIKAMQPQPG